MKNVILTGIFCLLLCFSHSGFTQSPPSETLPSVRISPHNEKNVALGWDFVHAVVAGDLDKVKTLLAADFVCYGPGAEDVNTIDPYFAIWRERYSQHSSRKTADIAGVSVEEALSEDGKNQWKEWVMLWFEYSADITQQNQTIKVPTQLTIRLVNGKIAELREYFDTGAVLRKLGQVR